MKKLKLKIPHKIQKTKSKKEFICGNLTSKKIYSNLFITKDIKRSLSFQNIKSQKESS